MGFGCGNCAAVGEEELWVVDTAELGPRDVEGAGAADEEEVGDFGMFYGEDEGADGFEEGHCDLG